MLSNFPKNNVAIGEKDSTAPACSFRRDGGNCAAVKLNCGLDDGTLRLIRIRFIQQQKIPGIDC